MDSPSIYRAELPRKRNSDISTVLLHFYKAKLTRKMQWESIKTNEKFVTFCAAGESRAQALWGASEGTGGYLSWRLRGDTLLSTTT